MTSHFCMSLLSADTASPMHTPAGMMEDAPGQYSVQKLNMALARARLE
jgi:hypothetical protein